VSQAINRRTFLKTTGAGVLAAVGVSCSTGRAEPAANNAAPDVLTGGDSSAVRLRKLELRPYVDRRGRKRRLLVLTDSDGATGWAEARLKSQEIHTATEALADVNLLDHEALWRALRKTSLPLGAIARADIAAWDLHARRRNKPLHTLIGTKRDKVPVYWSSHFKSSREDFIRWARAVPESGAKAVKCFTVRDRSKPLSQAKPLAVPDQLSLLREVRSLIGPDVEMLTDINFRLSHDQTLKLLEACDAEDKLNVSYVEEPCRITYEGQESIKQYAKLVEQFRTGISMLDIHPTQDHELRIRWIRAKALDLCRFDVGANGGITPALWVLAECRRSRTPLCLHGGNIYNTQIALTATAKEYPWVESFSPGDSGYRPAPTGPGASEDVDWTKVGEAIQPEEERTR
jgi:L-alanine-DL-glutamate epimerase-like enolase superfamily enzyme